MLAVRRPRLLSALLVLAALLLTLPAPASAATPPAQLARALERSPLYVDPLYADAVPPATRVRIERGLRQLDQRILVVLAPVLPGDAYGGRARNLIAVLRQRLADRGAPTDGTFAVLQDRYLVVEEFVRGREVYRPRTRDAVSLANFEKTGTTPTYRLPLADPALRFVANLRQPPARLSARVAAMRTEQQRTAERFREQSDGRRDNGTGTTIALVAVGVLLLAVVVLLLVRRRRGAVAVDGPLPVIPERVFRHAREARRADLRQDADRELLALATALDEQPVPSAAAGQDAYQLALDAYTAARRRMTPDAPSVDLVGVLVLVDRARSLLARAAALDAGRRPPEPGPLCTFNPLHGRAARTVAWREDLRVPACAACAADLAAGRNPDALRDGDQPYLEADSVWARTGFGALTDDLVERVARGER